MLDQVEEMAQEWPKNDLHSSPRVGWIRCFIRRKEDLEITFAKKEVDHFYSI